MTIARKNKNIFVQNERGSSLEMSLTSQWSSSLGPKMVSNTRSREQLLHVVTLALDLDQQWRQPLTWL